MQWRNGVSWPLVLGSATGYVVLQMASTRQGRTRKQSIRRRGGRALRSIASRNGPFGLCQAETFGNSFADSVSFRFPSWQSFDGHSVPPANCAQGSASPPKKSPYLKNKKGTGRLQACPLYASPNLLSWYTTTHLSYGYLVGEVCLGQLTRRLNSQ